MERLKYAQFKSEWQKRKAPLTSSDNGRFITLVMNDAGLIITCQLGTDGPDYDDYVANIKPSEVDKLGAGRSQSIPWADKKTTDGKKVFRRKHGIAGGTVSSGVDLTTDYTIPYAHCKVDKVEILGGKAGDKLDLIVLDDSSGTISGTPSAQLNQFGFDAFVGKDFYEDKSDYDADLYQGMVLRLVYKPANAGEVNYNVVLHEVKSGG